MRFLKSIPLCLGLGLMIGSVASPALAGSSQTYKIELNKTEIVRLPGAAASVVIGNPKIADVTVQSSDLLFVVGRGYGETNLIILDANGNTMMDADLQVINSLPNTGVRLFNGTQRETYSCIPHCGPSPVLGDDPDFIGNNTSQEDQLNTFPAQTASQPSQTSNNFDFSSQTAGGPDGQSTDFRPN